MNINYSKLYSSQLDNEYGISIKSTWGLKVWECVEDKKILRERKFEGWEEYPYWEKKINIIRKDQVFEQELRS